MPNNKTLTKLLFTSLTIVGIVSFSVLFNPSSAQVDGEGSGEVNCEYYFAESNNYTSIHTIVGNLNDGITGVSYKTWGTVTKYYLDSNGYQNFYIQSTDQNGNFAGMMIYRSSIEVAEGNVLTVEGIASLYNNLPEFVNPARIDVDYEVNSSSVETYVTDESFWQNGTNPSSSQFIEGESLGILKIALNDVVLTYNSSGNATVVFAGMTSVPLYYGYLSQTAAIDSYLYPLSGSTVDVVGYLHCYADGYTYMMQCLIRGAGDVISESSGSSLTLNSTNYYEIGTYSTGNYARTNVGGFNFEHYRVIKPSYGNPEFMILLPYFNAYGDGTAAGAFYNVSAINDIESIALTYRTEADFGIKPTLSYGEDISCGISIELDLSTISETATLEVANANFFKIETTGSKLYLESIEIDYANAGPADEFAFLSAGQNLNRINPIVSTGSLYDGKSVQVPSSIAKTGSYYAVQNTATYTYYSYDYIALNPVYADQAAYTAPEDVAAYFTTFGTWPANYVNKANYNAAHDLFGDDTRCVSTYSWDGGYAVAVPYQVGGGDLPLYHECDIALDSSYSGTNRGVGRVICWEYGFDSSKGAANYDSAPVCIYTDDHYATFQEYLNAGSFGTRFNAEMARTDHVWGAATTLLPS
ncbi:MAG: hypothetical protein WC344_00550 [Bacilli bacterium]|jgi:hypothetical protein